MGEGLLACIQVFFCMHKVCLHVWECLYKGACVHVSVRKCACVGVLLLSPCVHVCRDEMVGDMDMAMDTDRLGCREGGAVQQASEWGYEVGVGTRVGVSLPVGRWRVPS